MRVVAGVDCHKNTHTVAFVDSVGKVIRTLRIAATAEGYEEAIVIGRELGDVAWGLEGTGCYGGAFAQALSGAGFAVYEVPGVYTKRHRQRTSHRGKSDPIDALAVAEAVLREAERLPIYQYSAEREAIRIRYDQRDRLVREQTQCVNRLRSIALRLHLVDLPKNLTSRRALDQVNRGVQRMRSESVAFAALADDALFATEDIARIGSRVREICRALDPLMRRIGPELLEMRGVSTVTAAGLIGHAGDLRNCRDADAFAMRSGAAPVPNASGQRQGVRVNIGGNRQLNRLLYSIALVQLRSDDHPGRKYYDRKRSEGKSAKAAIRCLKRQLATVVYYRLVSAQKRLAVEITSVAA